VNKIFDDILAALDGEREFAGTEARFTKRLQLEKGDTVLARFLPVKMGARGTWFLRVGRHWVSRRPYFCKRVSSPDAGGDPNDECPLCRACEEHIHSRDDEVANAALQARATPQWVAYVIVRERGQRGREPQPVPKSDRLVPYEIWLTREAWLELSAIYIRSTQKGQLPMGILDPERGCDIWVTKDKRGVLHFDKIDPAPIDTKDAQRTLDRVLAKVKVQEFRPLAGDKLSEVLEKLEDAIQGGGRRQPHDEDDHRRSQGSSQEHLDDDSSRQQSSRSREDDRDHESPPSRAVGPHSEEDSDHIDRQGGRRWADDRRNEGTEAELRRSPHRDPDDDDSESRLNRRAAVEDEKRPRSQGRRPVDPLDDPADTGAYAGGVQNGDQQDTASEPPPRVHALPPLSVRRTGPLPPAPAKKQTGRVEDDPAGVPPLPYEPPPTPARPKVPLGDAVRRGIRAVQEAAASGDNDDLPPQRTSDGE
jgi:hypothetical protein